MKNILIGMTLLMVAEANAAHLMQAARTSTKMPIVHLARLYSYSNAPTKNLSIMASQEPIGNDWNAYAQIGWDDVLSHPEGRVLAKNKVRLFDALIRNKKAMVPARSFDECPAALYGGSGGALFGFWLALEFATLEATIAPLVCALIGVKLACVRDTFKRRSAYVHHLANVKKPYKLYAEHWVTAQDIQSELKEGFLDPIDGVITQRLPVVVLNDLTEESKRMARIQM
jgi:hypothetical protein